VKIPGLRCANPGYGAITGLIEKDIIERNEMGYEIINPVIKHLLREQLNY